MSRIKGLLGKRIKEIRILRNLTQEQLSEITNIGASSISKIESGIYHPTDDNLEKIASALDIEPYKLYMCDHIKDIDEIKSNILDMVNKANEDSLRLVYRILNGILD